MIVADGQLRGRADHPLGHAAVGLLRADLETAGQYRAGRGERHPVAHGEVDRAADDAAWLAGPGGHLAVPDRLAEPGQLLDLGDLGDDHAADVVPGLLERLDLQARGGQPPGHVAGLRQRLPEGGVLRQPGQWNAHQTSIPNARLNRTSPSSVSLMSVSPCRISRLRSMPRPNANPL